MACTPDECRIIECGAHLPKGFVRNILIDVDDLDSFRKLYKNRGVYATIYRYSTTDQNSAEIYGDLYFDFDMKSNFTAAVEDAKAAIDYIESVFGVDRASLDIFFSGSKGLHLLVNAVILDIKPHAHLNLVYKMVAEDIYKVVPNGSLDLKIYDKRRLFRLPNSIHQETGLYKVQLGADELEGLSYDMVSRVARRPRVLQLRQAPEKVPKAAAEMATYFTRLKVRHPRLNRDRKPLKLEKAPPCIEELSKGVSCGNRNNAAMVLCSYMFQQGLTQQEIEDKIAGWNNMLDEPLSSLELERCVKQICQNGYSYGCSSISGLATCDPRKCVLASRKKGVPMAHARS